MNEQDTPTVKFFRELSRRMYKENDLSDMVYALCRSNPKFKQFFLNFIFGKDVFDAAKCRMDREVWFENDRPDFVVTDSDEKKYFIEVKIGDAKHHFDQYAKRLDDRAKLGYITNYEISESNLSESDKNVFLECKKYGHCHTWKELKDALAKCIANRVQYQWATGDDIVGFLAYCEMVCPTPFEDESVNDYKHCSRKFEAIKGWYEALERCLKGTISIKIAGLPHTIKIKKYRVANTPAESIGIYFEAQDATDNIDDKEKMCNGQKIWGWAGWLLTEGFHPGFCIAFDNLEGWGAPVFKRLYKHEESWLSFCYDFPVANKGVDQIFSDAFKDVCERIITGKGEEKKATSHKVDESLYAARKLSLYLRQQVFPRLSCAGYRIEPILQKDSFNPKGWCGEYFAVKTNPSDGDDSKQIGVYWVGSYFDGNLRKDIKDGNDIKSEVVCEKIGLGVTKLLDDWANSINDFIKPASNDHLPFQS